MHRWALSPRKVVLFLCLVVALGLLLARPRLWPLAAADTQPAAPAGLASADLTAIQALLPPDQQAYLKASNTDADDRFGYRVALSGDTLAVSAPGEASAATGVNGNQADNSARFAGAVYVFVRSGAAWTQQAYLKASNTDAGDWFGASVALSGDTLVVGAFGESGAARGVNGDQSDNSAAESGAAYVFVRSGAAWTQQAYLKASNTGAGDWFGHSVALSGDTVVVSAPGEASAATGVNGDGADNSAPYTGAAYVFVRSGTSWAQQAYLKAPNNLSSSFGLSVALSGDTAVVSGQDKARAVTDVDGHQVAAGAPTDGTAYVFVRSGTAWALQASLSASDERPGQGFGASVAVSGDTVVVGAYNEDSAATGVNGNADDTSAKGAGAAYVFVRSGAAWTQQAYLKASNTHGLDQFGSSVAVSGDTVVVGAYGESSTARGVNSDQAAPRTYNTGAAYVFVRSGTAWRQHAYLKASSPDARDQFGWSVAVSGDTLVAGASGDGRLPRGEASAARGVNGDAADNSADGAGAAYVFGPGASTPSAGAPK